MSPLIQKVLYGIIALSIVAIAFVGFHKNFEQVEESKWQPLYGEAKTNPLYASKLFLRRMGIPTETIDSLQDLKELPSADTVIVISSSRQTLRMEQFNDLLSWVRNGGHLIVTGVADWQAYFGDALVDEPADSDDEISADSDPIQDFLNVSVYGKIEFDEKESVKINLRGSEYPLEIEADYYRAIVLNDENQKDGLEQVAINNNNLLIRQQVDEGLITLVANLDFVDNYNIGKFNHAEILWQLVRGKPATLGERDLLLPEGVWLIHSEEAANLFALIWRHFWALCITLTLLFVFWLLRVSRRFGPIIPKATEDRRNLLEHIDASGAYYWKQHNHEVLLESTRNATQQELAKRIPGWHAHSQEDQIKLLTKRLEINETGLLKTLYGNISTSSYEFTETIKQLEYIRTNL